jgi:hypothetical protein
MKRVIQCCAHWPMAKYTVQSRWVSDKNLLLVCVTAWMPMWVVMKEWYCFTPWVCGYVGVMTGMKPQQFSVALNARYCSPPWTTRTVWRRCTDYSCSAFCPVCAVRCCAARCWDTWSVHRERAAQGCSLQSSDVHPASRPWRYSPAPSRPQSRVSSWQEFVLGKEWC